MNYESLYVNVNDIFLEYRNSMYMYSIYIYTPYDILWNLTREFVSYCQFASPPSSATWHCRYGMTETICHRVRAVVIDDSFSSKSQFKTYWRVFFTYVLFAWRYVIVIFTLVQRMIVLQALKRSSKAIFSWLDNATKIKNIKCTTSASLVSKNRQNHTLPNYT